MMSLALLTVPAASNEGPPPQGVFGLVVLGNEVFFSATDDVHGRELWTSDVEERRDGGRNRPR